MILWQSNSQKIGIANVTQITAVLPLNIAFLWNWIVTKHNMDGCGFISNIWMLDIEWFSKKILFVEVNSIGFDEMKLLWGSEKYLGNWKNENKLKPN